MKRILAVILTVAVLQGCATAPGCSVYFVLPLPLPIVACGVDFSPPDAEEDDDV